MTPELRQVATMQVVGLPVRTCNRDEQSPDTARVGPAWQRFFAESIGSQIEDRLDDRLVAVYTDYESDDTGPYTLVIGHRVDHCELLPVGLTSVLVPAGMYLVFGVDEITPEAIAVAWRQVHDYFAQPDTAHRAFVADFELYLADCVEIHIGIA